MNSERLYTFRNRVFRNSVLVLIAITSIAFLIGFFLLPAAQQDFTAQGLWAGICRAAGAPSRWYGVASKDMDDRATRVVLERSMAAGVSKDAVGRGATLALNCTMCHGAQGLSISNAPNLAGQYPEVVIKQLEDYRAGRRKSPIMEAIARALKERDVYDLAAYYAYLPKARTAPTTYGEALPRLVRVGDPLRNIAPCVSCHGGVDQKLGAPWLEGMPKQYLADQLQAFRTESRRNDGEAQMRNMVRNMSEAEVDEVAAFYARKVGVAEQSP